MGGGGEQPEDVGHIYHTHCMGGTHLGLYVHYVYTNTYAYNYVLQECITTNTHIREQPKDVGPIETHTSMMFTYTYTNV